MVDGKTTQVMSRPSVYALSTEARDLLLTGSNGFDDDAGFDAWNLQLQGWLAKASDKFVACRVIIERAAAEAAFLKDQAKQLAERGKRFGAVEDRVKGLVKELLTAQVQTTGQNKIETADGSTVTLVETTQIDVDIADVNLLPTRFVRTVVEPDLNAIKAAYKRGEETPGAVCNERKTTSIRWGK